MTLLSMRPIYVCILILNHFELINKNFILPRIGFHFSNKLLIYYYTFFNSSCIDLCDVKLSIDFFENFPPRSHSLCSDLLF